MNILALDLGTQLGWALRSRGVRASGSESFAPRRNDGPGQRWVKFRRFLSDRAADAELGAIYYERPILMTTNGPATVLMFGGFEAHLELWAELNRVPLHDVNVSTIKKHWTGKGNAKKPDMLRVCAERGLKPSDDNEADALALLDFALCAEGEHTPTAIESQASTSVCDSAQVGKSGVWIDPFAAA